MSHDVSEHASNDMDVVDVAYVDDAGVMVTASPSAALARHIPVTVPTLQSTFSAFGLYLAWKPGKTAGVVRFWGAGPGTLRTSYVHPDGDYVQASDALCRVTWNKNLGAFFQIDGGLLSDATHKGRHGMAACSPIAYRWARLKYVRRLIMNAAPVLNAMLLLIHKGRRLAWGDLIIEHVSLLRRRAEGAL